MSTTRRVTINPNVEVHEISSIYDYTASEISASWYNEEEMDRITQRCFKILQKTDSGSSKNSKKYCVRGLESHTTLGSISKRNNREAAYTAVLEEQERQWNANDETDVQAISDAYRCTTSSCQLWAQVVGNRDQQEVEAYLYDDDEEEDEQEAKAAPSTACSLSHGSRIVQEAASRATVFARAA
mmetsp:Transcript_45733/g.110836  ORF Transcript_45733/g.110836 Transcript_45733/m.110836 type:complete len:184 (+) Transcript_45733:82-633(+)